MLITNKIKTEEIPSVSLEIYKIIKSDLNLTDRTLDNIKYLIGKSLFYICFDQNRHVIGFIAKEKIWGNYYEVKSWYVLPKYRGTGLSDKLFLKIIEEGDNNYIAGTFNKKIVKRLKEYRFNTIKLSGLPLRVMLCYLLTRNLGSIRKHIFKKSYLLLRE